MAHDPTTASARSGLSKVTTDALSIWRAGVDAVTPARLFRDKAGWQGSALCFDETRVELAAARRLIVVGAGKASAAMAVALQRQLLSQSPPGLRSLDIRGWINCPEGSFTAEDSRCLGAIHLHAARPAGINEPTAAAVEGTGRILDLVADCGPHDVVIVLLSGGGSALLVAPQDGISLAIKQAVAREISAAGGNIQQLNTVRRAISAVKGGGLARACRAGRLVTLVLSDVLGDQLETIASGPTLPHAGGDASQALETLEELGLSDRPGLQPLIDWLQRRCQGEPRRRETAPQDIAHVILGNNADAVDAAGVRAVQLGYRYVLQSARGSEGDVLAVAHQAAQAVEQLMYQHQVDCWISGGEPTVTLPEDGGGRGGRNQQLALAVLQNLRRRGWPDSPTARREIAFVSGGTDGEDGPTDAAGAYFDRELCQRLNAAGLDAESYLGRADAYPLFERLDGLLKTGATGTNVCDLRVALAEVASPS